MNTYTLKSKGVASKILHQEVTEFIGGIISEFSVLWERDVHRDAILEVLEEYLEERALEGRITQYNVVCDARNNNEVLSEAGITNLEVHYKQDNCYVTTVLTYVIIDET
jgi:hypothetical protein